MAENPKFDLPALMGALAPDTIQVRWMTLVVDTTRSKTQMKKLLVRQLAWMCRITVKGREVSLTRKSTLR